MTKINLKQIFTSLKERFENLKKFIQEIFIAKEEDLAEPQLIRKKHLRLGVLVASLFIILCFLGNAK